MRNIVFEALAEAARNKEPVSLGIISGVKGSSPQKVGAKALFYADGRITGTLGGGCLEAEIQQRAIQALRTGQSSNFDLLLDHDFGWDDGLICGGKVLGLIRPNAQSAGEAFWQELAERRNRLIWGISRDFSIARDGDDKPDENWFYRESVTPPSALWIAGAGHVAQAVAPLALQLDFEVTVFDDRPTLANSHYFPAGTKFRVDYWEKLLKESLPHRPTFGLIVTHGHQHDALVLRDWVRRPFVFLGLIGSKRKRRIIFEQFIEDGLATAEQLANVACPVGLDI